jgi:hypothetical protein
LGVLAEYQYDDRDHAAPLTTADNDIFAGYVSRLMIFRILKFLQVSALIMIQERYFTISKLNAGLVRIML